MSEVRCSIEVRLRVHWHFLVFAPFRAFAFIPSTAPVRGCRLSAVGYRLPVAFVIPSALPCYFEHLSLSFRAPFPVIPNTIPCHFERSEKSAFFDVRSQMFEVRLKVHWHFSGFRSFRTFAFSLLLSFRSPTPVISNAVRNLLFSMSEVRCSKSD